MKITKQRIIEIIKEEIENQSGEQSIGGDSVSGRQDLGDKMIAAGKQIKQASNIDAPESELIFRFLDSVVKAANDDNAKTSLMAALEATEQKLGTDK